MNSTFINAINSLYSKSFNYIAKAGLEDKRYEDWQAHALIISMITTSFLMWSYAIIAFLYIDETQIPFIVGTTASIIHLLSPLLIKWTKSITISVNILLLAGLSHQSTFAFYTGGFHSYILIWFGVLPIIAGITNGKKGAITWCLIPMVVSSIFLYLLFAGITPHNNISETGKLLAQILMVFGWILLTFTLISTFTFLKDDYSNKLLSKNERIEALVRVLCHDISSPIMVFKHKLSRLQRKYPDFEKETLDSLQEYSMDITNFIHKVREWQSLENKNYTIDAKKVHLNPIMDKMRDQFEIQLKNKNLKIEFLFSKEKDFYAWGDNAILSNHIFSNLISNAIKFSPSSSTITIDIVNSFGIVQISVEDKGIGIPEDIQETMFQPNKNTSRRGTNNEAGSGFGLPIVDSFIKLLKGSISVESKESTTSNPESGTKFTITLATVNTIN